MFPVIVATEGKHVCISGWLDVLVLDVLVLLARLSVDTDGTGAEMLCLCLDVKVKVECVQDGVTSSYGMILIGVSQMLISVLDQGSSGSASWVIVLISMS